jgi:hypothetical protein
MRGGSARTTTEFAAAFNCDAEMDTPWNDERRELRKELERRGLLDVGVQ